MDITVKSIVETHAAINTKQAVLQQQRESFAFAAADCQERLNDDKRRFESEYHKTEAEVVRVELLLQELNQIHLEAVAGLTTQQEVCMYVCMCVCVYVCMYWCVCVCMYV